MKNRNAKNSPPTPAQAPGTEPKGGLSVRAYRTTKTPCAAALLTLGVPWLDPRQPVCNRYDEDHPYRPDKPGTIFYVLAGESAEGAGTNALADAYWDEHYEAHGQFLELLDAVERGDSGLGVALKKLFPMVQANTLRAGFENREAILDLWRKARPMVLVKRANGLPTLIPRDASDELKKRWGVA